MALEQPKQPAGGAFGSFMAAKRSDFQAKCPGKPVSVVMQLASETWKKLSVAEKAPYEKTFADAKAKYIEDLAAFTAAGGVKTKGPGALRKEKKLMKLRGSGDAEIMALAKQENLDAKLKKLMTELGIRDVFKALQDAQGSIKGAKRILLGGVASEGGDNEDESPPKRAKVAGASKPEDADIMAQAKKGNLHMKLQKLMDLPKVTEKQLDTSTVFQALQDAAGSVVAAKRALLGA